VFKLLQQQQWRMKLSKCSFADREISYLGYVISEHGVSTCLDKVKVVVEWITSRNVKELRSFLGLADYSYWQLLAEPLALYVTLFFSKKINELTLI
jgi:hypothetical protein